MRQVCFFLTFSLCFLSLLKAQEDNFIQPGRDGIYQIFLGEAVFGTEQEKFANARAYGFMRPFSIAEEGQMPQAGGVNPIFIGPYLGKKTAQHMLELIRKAGYPSAYIEGDEESLIRGEGSELTHTVQVGAYEQLDASFFAPYSNQAAHGLFILYEEGLYKICAGLYSLETKPYLKEKAIPYWKNAFSMSIQPFVRAFRLPYEGGR